MRFPRKVERYALVFYGAVERLTGIPNVIKINSTVKSSVSFFSINKGLRSGGRLVLDFRNHFKRGDHSLLDLSCHPFSLPSSTSQSSQSAPVLTAFCGKCAAVCTFFSCLYFWLRFPPGSVSMIGHGKSNNFSNSVRIGGMGLFDNLLGRAECDRSSYLTKGPSPPVCDAHLRRALEHAVVREGMKISVGFEMPVRSPVQLKGKMARCNSVVNGVLTRTGGRRSLRKGPRSEEEVTMAVVKEGNCRILEEDALQIDRKVSEEDFREETDGTLHTVSSVWVEKTIVRRHERSPKATRVSKSVCSSVKRLCDKERGKKRNGDEVEDMDIVPSKVGNRRHKLDTRDEIEHATVQEKKPNGCDEFMGEADLKETSWLSDDHSLLKSDIGGKDARCEDEGKTSYVLDGSVQEAQGGKSCGNKSSKQHASTEDTITFKDAKPASSTARPESGPSRNSTIKARGSTTLLSQKRELQLSVTKRLAYSTQPVQKVPRLSSSSPSPSSMRKITSASNAVDSARARRSQTAKRSQRRAHVTSYSLSQELSALPSAPRDARALIEDVPSLSRGTSQTDEEASCEGSVLPDCIERARPTANPASVVTSTQKKRHVHTTKLANQRGPFLRKQNKTNDTKARFISNCAKPDNSSSKVLRTQTRDRDAAHFSNNSGKTNKVSPEKINPVKNGGTTSEMLSMSTNLTIRSLPPNSELGNESELTSAGAANTQNTAHSLKSVASSAMHRNLSFGPPTSVGTKRLISLSNATAFDSETQGPKRAKIQVGSDEDSAKNGQNICSNEMIVLASREDQAHVCVDTGNGLTRNQMTEFGKDSAADNGERSLSTTVRSRPSSSVSELMKRRSDRSDKALALRAIPARRKSVSQLGEDKRYHQTLDKLDPFMKQTSPPPSPGVCLDKSRKDYIPSSSPPRVESLCPRISSEAECLQGPGKNETSSVRKSKCVKRGGGKSIISPKLCMDIEGANVQGAPYIDLVDESAGNGPSMRARLVRIPGNTTHKMVTRGIANQDGNDLRHRKPRKEMMRSQLLTTDAVSSILLEGAPYASQVSCTAKEKCSGAMVEVSNEYVQRYLNISKDSSKEGRTATVLQSDHKSSNSISSELDSGSCEKPTESPILDCKDPADADEIITYCFNSFDCTEKIQDLSREQVDSYGRGTKSVKKSRTRRSRPRLKPSSARQGKSDKDGAVKTSKNEEEAKRWPPRDIRIDKTRGLNRRTLKRNGEYNKQDENAVKQSREQASRKNPDVSYTVKCRLRTREHIADADGRDRDSNHR